MTAIRLGTAALSRRIFAGRPNKAGDGFKGERHDVTSDVLKVVAEHIGMDREATVCCEGEPAYFVAVKSIVARRTEVSAEQDALEQYVAEYELCCDDGYYTPTEHERGLIMDAMQGWLVDRQGLVAEARAASGMEARQGGDAKLAPSSDDSPAPKEDAPTVSAYNPDERLRELEAALREALDMVVDCARDSNYSVSEFNALRSALSPLPQGDDT